MTGQVVALATVLAGAAGWVATCREGRERLHRLQGREPGSLSRASEGWAAVSPSFAAGGARAQAAFSRTTPERSGWIRRGGLGGGWMRRAHGWQPSSAGARREAREAAALELCRAMAAELRTGQAVESALVRAILPLLTPRRDALAAETALQPALSQIRAAVDSGLDVPAALRGAARAPGAGLLARMAVCCDVGASTGAGLAAALDRLGEGAAQDDALRREVAAQLAGPRATARLLLLLPLIGLALGTGLGADPVTALIVTNWGRSCLLAAACLDLVGWWWTRRLVAAVAP